MHLTEFLYNIKKSVIRFYKKYFTISGVYTCILPDSIYLRLLYKERMGRKLNLRHPVTYTEKLQWLKLHDRKPEYTMMVDKYAVRKYVAEKIGEQYLVPLIGVWDRVEDIDFDALPEKFVLKCNHDNGVIICKDKSHLDIEATKKNLQYHLNRDYYKKGREWPYKNVKRKIICEQFMENSSKIGEVDTSLVDYKIFCFNGNPEFIMVNSNRAVGTVKTDIYDLNWNYLDMQDGHYDKAGNIFNKPDCFDELISLARKLAENHIHLRVDFNYWDNKLYFGELTFYHNDGFSAFEPAEIWGEKMSSLMKI